MGWRCRAPVMRCRKTVRLQPADTALGSKPPPPQTRAAAALGGALPLLSPGESLRLWVSNLPRELGPCPSLAQRAGPGSGGPPLPLHRPAGIFPRAGPARLEEGSCGHFQGLLLLIPHGYRDHVVPEVAALGVQDGRLWLRAALGLLSVTRQRAEMPLGQVEAAS